MNKISRHLINKWVDAVTELYELDDIKEQQNEWLDNEAY